MAKLKGSTLVEIMIAMVIILFCTTLATVIYLNILKSQNTGEKLRAFYVLKKAAETAENKTDFMDSELKENGFTIRKICKSYKNNPSLIEIRLTATNEEGKVLIYMNKIVLHQ